MFIYNGKGVYSAVAIGHISVYKRQTAAVTRIEITDTAAELKRVEAAKALAIEQLQAIYDKALKDVGEENAAIFEVHMMMLDDEDYNDSIKNIIETEYVNAEYAVSVTAENFAEMFAAMDDSYFQARAADIKDISNRLIVCLTDGGAKQDSGDEKVIICADDLAPSETVSLDKEKVLAFVTAYGSSNSHTAILARNMNIPAIIGVYLITALSLMCFIASWTERSSLTLSTGMISLTFSTSIWYISAILAYSASISSSVGSIFSSSAIFSSAKRILILRSASGLFRRRTVQK